MRQWLTAPFYFAKENTWRTWPVKVVTGVFPTIGILQFIRDNVNLPSPYRELFDHLLVVPHWQASTWAIIILSLFSLAIWDSGYQAWKELQESKTPILSILFDSASPDCMRPVPLGIDKTLWQACVYIKNESRVDIDQMEIYCEDIQIIKPVPKEYAVQVDNYPLNPVPLTSQEKWPAGIVAEQQQINNHGVQIILVTIPQKCAPVMLEGAEFAITVGARGTGVKQPTHATYSFGKRNGRFYFEEVVHDAIRP